MTRAATSITAANGGTAVTTLDRVPTEVWQHVELVSRLHELLARTRNEATLPALLTVIHPHLTYDRQRPSSGPPIIDLALVRQLSRLLGAARCPDLLLAVLDELAPHLHLPGSATTPAPLPDGGALSGREVQVLAAIARGRTNASIGSELGLSEDTVKTHARRLFTKLGARDRAHAVALGYQHDILGGAA